MQDASSVAFIYQYNVPFPAGRIYNKSTAGAACCGSRLCPGCAYLLPAVLIDFPFAGIPCG